MTWSIVAREGSGALGVAVASHVTVRPCPHVRAGVGAVASQGLLNPEYGPRCIELLAAGYSPADAIKLTALLDVGREQRQVHAVDARGRTAAFTGKACHGYRGHVAGEGFSVAGNILAGRAVFQASAREFERGGSTLAERLIAALLAGARAGGDRRGTRSAAVIVCEPGRPRLALLVDDEADPVAMLAYHYVMALAGAPPLRDVAVLGFGSPPVAFPRQ